MPATHPIVHKADQLKLANQNKEAVTLLTTHLPRNLDNVSFYEELGDNYCTLKEYGKSKKALNYALSLQRTANALYLLGFVHSALGDYARSIELLDEANAKQPNHPEILRCLAWSLFHGGHRAQGLAVMRRASALAPRDALIWCDRAVLHLSARQWDDSIQCAQRAIEIDPKRAKYKDVLENAQIFKRDWGAP